MATMLVIALLPNNYSYYIMLRYVVCFGAICLALYGAKVRSTFWISAFCIIVVVFNPLSPIHAKRSTWQIVDCIAAIVLMVSIPLLNAKKEAGAGKNGNSDVEKNSAGLLTKTTQERQKNKETQRDREPEAWEQHYHRYALMSMRDSIVKELSGMKITDWEDYALRAICTHSPSLSHLLVDGELNIELIKNSERAGINKTIEIIMNVDASTGMSLRDYFHKIFEEIYRGTNYSGGNKFFWYGRDRVIEALRSYKISAKTIVPKNAKFYDVDGRELEFDSRIDAETVQKVKESLEYFEKEKQKYIKMETIKNEYRFKIQSAYPFIEFDLEAVQRAGVFSYGGSLVNSLYDDVKQLLSISTDYTYLGYSAAAEPLYDVIASSFAVGNGVLVLVKYKGAVEYFPDRLYVELQDIQPNSWIMRWILSYKQHLEGND